MSETPYCPLLSINKEVSVLCQEELCMWYIKQLKLCSITVSAYTNAMSLQNIGVATASTAQGVQKPQQTPSAKVQSQVKQNLTNEPPKKEQPKAVNPFALDDLD